MKLKQLFCNHIWNEKNKIIKVNFEGYFIYVDKVLTKIKSIDFKFDVCIKCGKETFCSYTIHSGKSKCHLSFVTNFTTYIVDLAYNKVSNNELLSGKYPMEIIDSNE